MLLSDMQTAYANVATVFIHKQRNVTISCSFGHSAALILIWLSNKYLYNENESNYQGRLFVAFKHDLGL